MLLVLPQTEHGERSPVNDGSRGACGPDNNLDRRIPFQCPYGLDLAAQPARCDIKTVWPGRHAIFHEDAQNTLGRARAPSWDRFRRPREIVLSPTPSLNVARRRWPPRCLIFATLIIIETRDLGERRACQSRSLMLRSAERASRSMCRPSFETPRDARLLRMRGRRCPAMHGSSG
jgi:hypothetical protein